MTFSVSSGIISGSGKNKAQKEPEKHEKTETKKETLALGKMKVLFSEKQIDDRVREMGAQISKDYANKQLIVVGLLKGAFMFLSDLVKRITVPMEIDFMILSSYEGTNSRGSVCVQKDMQTDPMGKDILIVEDLIDTGTTLAWLCHHLQSKKCKSVRLCTFLNKQTSRRIKQVNIDYVGFECTDEFVVGYGMDYNQQLRNLPYVGFFEQEKL
ncbi:hypoxanthine phosphoribosyltransferase [Reticulomyxa filosa]|uniref:Hypoxanthine phosphoribosyltransferase n=1 Tax=Reticulomyxa filosa TaxID=46433 RepID=X6MKP6_RETFI|nr:hypoxanthine phosphoribosyltransferase [Reticulomyxa filosa]|eukprot:ETO14399.1 hypoxanthine phosphoribosyltransferase [Reticulomyxa filosa]